MLREWVFVGWVKTFSGSITQMILKQLDARKDNLQLISYDSNYDKAVVMKMHIMRLDKIIS